MSQAERDAERLESGATPTQIDRRGGRRRPSAWRASLGSAVLAVLGFLALWTFVSMVILDEQRRAILLPPPWEVLAVLGQSNLMETMLAALGQTAVEAVLGLVFAVVIGIGWAVAMAQSRIAERVLYPYAVVLQTIPILALTPLIGMWVGYGVPARVVVAVIISVFPIIANTFFGLTAGPSSSARDLFTLARATRWQRLMKLEAPAALPAIFTGLRASAGLSVIGAIVGDFFFQQGSAGIGGLLRTYAQQLQPEALFMAVGLTALFGVIVFTGFATAERLVLGKWFGKRN